MDPVKVNCPACNLRFEVPKQALENAKPAAKPSKKKSKKKAASK